MLKKILIMVVLACLMMPLANAAPLFYKSQPEMAGQFDFSGNKVLILQASDISGGGAFSNQIFSFTPTMGKEALGVMLSAIALGKPVFLYVDLSRLDVYGYPIVEGIFLQP